MYILENSLYSVLQQLIDLLVIKSTKTCGKLFIIEVKCVFISEGLNDTESIVHKLKIREQYCFFNIFG